MVVEHGGYEPTKKKIAIYCSRKQRVNLVRADAWQLGFEFTSAK
jgi:hypothetical protein